MTTIASPNQSLDYGEEHRAILERLYRSFLNGWGWEYVGDDNQPLALEMAMYGGYCIREIGNKTFFEPLRFQITPKGIMKLAEDGLYIPDLVQFIELFFGDES